MKTTGIVGKQFNSWTVTKALSNKMLECRCECGNIGNVRIYDLINNKSRMCNSCSSKSFRGKRTHQLSKTRLYRIWKGIKRRCLKKSSTRYEDYGGRGILICEDWANDFMTFYKWAMENKYKRGLEIDRIDVNGNYEPSNCRWVTKTIQNNNTRRNRYIYYKNKKYTLSQLSKAHGLDPTVVHKRLKRGWSLEEAITIKLNGRRKKNEKSRNCA